MAALTPPLYLNGFPAGSPAGNEAAGIATRAAGSPGTEAANIRSEIAAGTLGGFRTAGLGIKADHKA